MRMQTFFCPNFEADRRENSFYMYMWLTGGDNVV